MIPPDFVRLDGDEIVVRRLGVESRAPLSPPKAKEPEFVSFRRDASYAVWDRRGLSVRKGDRIVTTKLSDLVPNEGDADALSGAVRFRSRVFFLLRWTSDGGKTRAERLVAVDLSEARPRWRVLGSFDGFSVATGRVAKALRIGPRGLTVTSRLPDGTWGFASFDAVRDRFSFLPVGRRLVDWRDSGLFVERSDRGYRVGIAATDGGSRLLHETDGLPQILDDAAPALVRADGRLRNAFTGASLRLNEDQTPRRVGASVAIVNRAARRATLYRPDRWLPLAATP